MSDKLLDPKTCKAKRDLDGRTHLVIENSSNPSLDAHNLKIELEAAGFRDSVNLRPSEGFETKASVGLPIKDGDKFKEYWESQGGTVESAQARLGLNR